jgi:thymidylate kinase
MRAIRIDPELPSTSQASAAPGSAKPTLMKSSSDQESLERPAPMHIALIGSTSAGKTTLARAIVQACEALGLEASLSEDFAARHLGVPWLKIGFAQRRVLELGSLLYCLAGWRRHRDYLAVAFRLIRDAPGSWLYKAGLLRLTLRKTGIHEIVRRRLKSGQVVISDNEAILQGAHHLFVHPTGSDNPTAVDGFAALAPLPDVVVYLRAPDPVVVERTLRRGHPRLDVRSSEVVERTIRDTTEVFERLCAAPALTDRLLVVEGRKISDAGRLNGSATAPIRRAARLIETGLDTVERSRKMRHPEADEFELSPRIARELVDRLNDEVGYCHWKSNYFMARGEDDDGDLDLLVDPSDLSRVQRILAALHFKEALVPSGPRTPGVWHYFGYDRPTGKLVHVHLFNRVITGESFVKSHRLPLDSMLLDNTGALGTVRIPAKEAELVLFILRTFIKYGSLLDVLRLAKGRGDIREELRWLESRCSVSDALRLLEMHCPPLGEGLFLECLAVLHNDAPLIRRILLARKVRSRLRVYAVRGRLARAAAYLQFLGAYGRRKLLGIRKGKVWHSGGTVIAFVGPDATGKSTMVGETARWLRRVCGVSVAHLGKPPSSPWTAPINAALAALKVVRSMKGRKERWRPDSGSESAAATPVSVGWPSLIYALRAVVLAFDRERAVRKTWLSATRGGVVICDRYPTSQVGAMDGPRITARPEARGTLAAIHGWLARLESRLYGSLPQPDVLIRLTVSVETAKQRNRERQKADKHTDEDLENRHQSLGSWSTRSNRCWEVSTEGTLDETLSRAKQAIWEAL